MKSFLIKSTLLTLIVFLLGLLFYSTVLKPFYIAVLPFAVLFFYLITNLVHAYLLKIAGKSGARFTSQYTAVSFLKMFFYLAVAIVYVIIDRDHAKPFMAGFLVLYVIYTVFEVNEYLKFIKQKN
jgi:phosphotransferase system  glucose/maltose/N-acetylglucosamine-specific IIC component